MKTKRRMTCPLSGGVIDSDLCCDIQECIEGNIPVSLELEDFLSLENHKEICHRCEFNYLYEPDDDGISFSKPGFSCMNEAEKKELISLLEKLDHYRYWMDDLKDREQDAYEQLSEEKQESEEGSKQERLISALHLGVNYLQDIVSSFGEFLEDADEE